MTLGSRDAPHVTSESGPRAMHPRLKRERSAKAWSQIQMSKSKGRWRSATGKTKSEAVAKLRTNLQKRFTSAIPHIHDRMLDNDDELGYLYMTTRDRKPHLCTVDIRKRGKGYMAKLGVLEDKKLEKLERDVELAKKPVLECADLKGISFNKRFAAYELMETLDWCYNVECRLSEGPNPSNKTLCIDVGGALFALEFEEDAASRTFTAMLSPHSFLMFNARHTRRL